MFNAPKLGLQRLIPTLGVGAPWANISYLSVLLLYPMTTGLFRVQARDFPGIQGERLDVLVQASLLIAACTLWIFASLQHAWPRQIRIFLVLLFVSWAYTVTILWTHGDELRREYVALPVALFLIFFKPLTLNQLLVVLRVVLVGVLVFSVLSLPGLRLNSADYGKSIVTEFLGLDPGWQGFAPGVQGSMGLTVGLLALLSLMLPSKWSWVFFPLGAIAVFAVGADSSLVGFAAGVIVLLFASRKILIRRIGLGVLAVVMALVITLLFTNPSGSGRTLIWIQWLQRWVDRPFFGTGNTGIEQFTTATHGHNFFVDALVRTGLIGLMLYVAVIAFAFLLASRAALGGSPQPMAALICMMIAGMFNIEPYFNFWSIGTALLVLTVLLSRQPDEIAAVNNPLAPPDPSKESHANRTDARA